MSNSTHIQSEATECSTPSARESINSSKVADSDGFFDKLAACLPPEEFNSDLPNDLDRLDKQNENNDNKVNIK